MEQIVVRVRNKKKAKLLLEVLQALDFVELVSSETEVPSKPAAEETDFFALAGLWQNREINLNSIRENAWPRQQ